MMPFPDTFDDNVAALPIERMGLEGQQALQTLRSKGYDVKVGLTAEYADEIAKLSREPSIREYCPNDCLKRFANRQATADWLASSKRATYLLFQKSDHNQLVLAGYGWIGAKTNTLVPVGETTFSLRIGESHQGQGLAAPFATSLLTASEVSYATPHLWLETWASNGGAVHIYNKLGFTIVAQKDDERPTVSGEMVTDTRLFMTNYSNSQTGTS